MKIKQPNNKYICETIYGNVVEFIFEEKNEPDYITKYWTVQFTKTPKGRKKIIAEIVEEFDPDDKRVIHISLYFNDSVTNKERTKIKRYLTDGLNGLSKVMVNAIELHPCIDGFVIDFV